MTKSDGTLDARSSSDTDRVREHYAAAARAAAVATAPIDERSVAAYSEQEQAELPDLALTAALGCGNPVLLADLRPGERVLDLGSGGGLDVLLSARRVAPGGLAYGLDMTDEMMRLARRNQADAGVTNVEWLRGDIAAVPLPDESVDVVISNCVVNLASDKDKVFAEMYRVLKPGGRLGVADIVAENTLSPAQRAERGSYAGCIAGALSEREYADGLTAAGFHDVTIVFTHSVAEGMHGAAIKAHKPARREAGPPAPESCVECE